MGTQLSSELGNVKGSEEEEWQPTSVTLLPGTSLLFHHSPMVIRALGQPFNKWLSDELRDDFSSNGQCIVSEPNNSLIFISNCLCGLG